MLNAVSPATNAKFLPRVSAIFIAKWQQWLKYRNVKRLCKLPNGTKGKVPKNYAPNWQNSAIIQPTNVYTKAVALALGYGSPNLPYFGCKFGHRIAQPKAPICRMPYALRCNNVTNVNPPTYRKTIKNSVTSSCSAVFPFGIIENCIIFIYILHHKRNSRVELHRWRSFVQLSAFHRTKLQFHYKDKNNLLLSIQFTVL